MGMKQSMNIKDIEELCGRTDESLKKWFQNDSNLPANLINKIKKALQSKSPVRFGFNQVVQILQAMRKPITAKLLREYKESIPKVKNYDHFMNSKGYKTVNQVAKEIGTGRTRLFDFLRKGKMLFLSGGNNLPYQRCIEAGYFKMKGTSYNQESKPVGYSQIFITPKGEDWIAKRWRKAKGKEPSKRK